MSPLEKTLRWIIIGGAFALPFVCLIVADGIHFPYNLFFPYITGKNFVFRILVEIMTGGWLALALVNPKYRPRRSWVLAAFSVFVILIAISDAHGVMPSKSFWSNFERMDGWVTLIHLLAYLFVVVSVINTEKLWRWLFRVSIGVSVLVSLLGFLQIFGDMALGTSGTSGLSARIDATFGNPIYLAVYMLFHIFLAALLWLQDWKDEPRLRFVLSWLYGGAIFVDTVALLFTGTRGTILGLGGGVALALLIYALSPVATKRFRNATVIIYIAGVVCAGGLWLARDTSFVHRVGFLDRLASISLHDTTIASRFVNMSIAWKGVQERPILGWGQANYAIVFDKYYDPRMYHDEPWFDRVHDIIFDWWIVGGTLGLLAYLSILAAAVWELWRPGAFDWGERAILTGLLAGYFIHNLTVFDNITSYILFIMFLGYVVWRSGERRGIARITEARVMPEAALPFVAVVATILVWLTAWWVNAAAFAQNRVLLLAIQPSPAGLQQNYKDFEQAIAYNSLGTQEVREQLIHLATTLASSKVDAATKQEFFNLAVAQMKKQEQASPLDARFPLFLGGLYQSYGDYADALKEFEKAHQLSPGKQSILYAIAQIQEVQGNTAASLQTFKQAYDLLHSDNDARFYYAAALIRAGDDAQAQQLLAPFIPTGAAADPRIAAAYASRHEYLKIAAIWEARVKATPTDTQAYFTLGAAYYQAGDIAKAVDALKRAEAADPSVKTKADALIQDIEKGNVKVQ